MNIFQRIVIPYFASKAKTNQSQSSPVPLVYQNASGQEQFLDIDQTYNWDLILHLAADCHVLTRLSNFMLGWVRPKLIFAENHLVVLSSAIKVT
jgi:hypothetical protein